MRRVVTPFPWLFVGFANKLWRPAVSLARQMSSSSVPSPPPPIRVGVLGGGVAGCSAAGRLSALGFDVTLHEMGRSVGGRAATRRTREEKRIAVNHGAPFFQVRSKKGEEEVQALVKGGFVAPCPDFTPMVLDVEGKKIIQDESVETGMKYFSGLPTMDRICEGLLNASVAKTKIEKKFGKMIRQMEPLMEADGKVRGWSLKDGDGTVLGEYDWLVVSGSGVMHPRWRLAFGGDPPLSLAAETSLQHSAKLKSLLTAVGDIGSRPVQVVMMGFKGEAAGRLLSLPSAPLLKMRGHKVISKISVQKLPPPEGQPDSSENLFVAVVAHSTHEFAQTCTDVFGSTSTAARVGNATSPEEREKAVTTEIVKGVDECLGAVLEGALAPCAETCCWGPLLHRWGNAFPSLPTGATSGGVGSDLALIADCHLAVCGDFVGPAELLGSVEGAILSGVQAAELVGSAVGLKGASVSPSAL
uniref:Amine oxidase domain-containing protein n=1 Tax=Chromera velia CCMP2878 TaxID=1169474 RepID=A0A0G4GL93_9ALVE|mmetsp:Transcript_50356/g.99150  ORF Transcript_50356/g.99150 Transcript_50356/m.99150 type:complete len:471 (-) Transcript_50356:94-1506(-)|eukprot:Cvel_4865.t1-p1 / transcript=Cvel_4865.t1 / gene=Cvel_4865 / organism=Chromera_velia_CCMP2878 / gene_product=hypothetical protein / transcript_product=hypothetical protein / location=Cvel_scaffold219:90870-92917(+) / protein_length=470 / sequence_SO=supercontig / SO=protein_coding / is_pseudo=false